jgi:hypothetical protein
MKAATLSGALLLALVFPAAPLFAHHGTAGSYDQNKVVKVTGTVKEFRWRNPHSALFVTGKDVSGAELTYTLEMGSPNTLVKFGYTRDTFKPGDALIIDMHPSFTNPESGEALSREVTINGKVVKQLQSER